MNRSTDQHERSSYIATLDGWRAIAVLAVVISHSQETYRFFGWGSPVFLEFTQWCRLGVDLFFAISGFLICNRLLHELDSKDKISLKNFYIRRLFRILPLYFFYLAFLFVVSKWAEVPASTTSLTSCVFFYRNYIDPVHGAYTNHFWSLSVEEHFYLLWPIILSLAGSRRALWISVILAVLVHLWRSADSRLHLLAPVLPHAEVLWRTDTRIDALLWGCSAAIFCFQRTVNLPSWFPFMLLVMLVGAIAVHLPALPLFLAIFFPVLIVSTISNSGSMFGAFLELPLLRWIGGLSYSIYIWQTIFLQSDTTDDPGWLHTLKIFPLNYLIVFVLSVVSHYLLERPLIHLGRLYQRRGMTARLEASAIAGLQ